MQLSASEQVDFPHQSLKAFKNSFRINCSFFFFFSDREFLKVLIVIVNLVIIFIFNSIMSLPAHALVSLAAEPK